MKYSNHKFYPNTIPQKICNHFTGVTYTCSLSWACTMQWRDRLLKITDLYWQNQDYRLQDYADYRANVRNYSHIADPCKFCSIYTFDRIITDSPESHNPVQNAYFCLLHWKFLPIMLALCSMLLPPYYAQNYAGTIGSNLIAITSVFGQWLVCNVVWHMCSHITLL